MGRAGIVLGLEVSRLARNSTDWHRLLEICALTDTLILDEDGVYSPSDFNDRLLLGLKGTMSEAELHVMRARLRGGILNQARRGALQTPLPVGLVYDPEGNVVLDPDGQVQRSFEHLFETFERTGSASATVKHFREQGLRFPRRPRFGPHKGELLWESLRHWRVLRVLHNPRYAGAFCFGRTHTRKRVNGTVEVKSLPREEWTALLLDAHPGYIAWEQFEANLRRLRDNAQAHGSERRKSPPREGPALIQGLVVCGVCGHRMTVRYHTRKGDQWPEYVCQRLGHRHRDTQVPVDPRRGHRSGHRRVARGDGYACDPGGCLEGPGRARSRIHEADALRRQRVERARQEADLARRRFMEVDPGNRLVADVLEAEWNEKLRGLHDAQEELEQRRQQDHPQLSDEQRAQIFALATDFPRLWNDPKTPQRERKRMVRLLIEDVTLTKGDEIAVGVRFRGGATRSLALPIPPTAWELRQTSKQVVAEIDTLLDDYTEAKIASILNDRGHVSGEGKRFHAGIVRRLRRDYDMKKRYDRLRDTGLLTLEEMADLLGVATNTVKTWRNHGLLRAHAYNDKNECLYEHPGDHPPVKAQGRKLSKRRRFLEVLEPNRTEEVQCEA